MRNRLLQIFLCASGLFASCAPDHTPDVTVSEIPSTWNRSEPVDVFYENTDTLALQEINVLVRFRNDFHYERLDFVVETQAPDSLFWRDTLSVRFINPEETEAVSLTYTDVKSGYRSKSRLNQAGPYRFRFTHAMPESDLRGVIGVGIETTKN